MTDPHGSADYNVVMCSFQGEDTAGEVLKRIESEKLLEGREIEEGALVSRDAGGEVHLHERGGAAVGAGWGIVTAGILGYIAGPVILLLMVIMGGLWGGVAGHFAGKILPAAELREAGEALPPGSSAYLALVERHHAAGVASVFEAEGARIVNVPVETEVSSVIREAITHRVRRA